MSKILRKNYYFEVSQTFTQNTIMLRFKNCVLETSRIRTLAFESLHSDTPTFQENPPKNKHVTFPKDILFYLNFPDKKENREKNNDCQHNCYESMNFDISLKFWTFNTEAKGMLEADVHVTNEFEIGEKKIWVYLLNQALDEGALDEEEFFVNRSFFNVYMIIISHMQKVATAGWIFLYWKNLRFDLELLDDEEHFLDFLFTKRMSFACVMCLDFQIKYKH